MEIASKNIQQELVDVNNLWHWPVAYSSDRSYHQPATEIVPELDTWYANIAANGYINMNSTIWPRGTFDKMSVTSESNSGYSIGVFMKFEPGEYDFSCDEILAPNQISVVRFVEYQLMPNGKYLWSIISQSTRFNGHCQAKFTVKPDNLILLHFSANNENMKRTFTNIRIW